MALHSSCFPADLKQIIDTFQYNVGNMGSVVGLMIAVVVANGLIITVLLNIRDNTIAKL